MLRAGIYDRVSQDRRKGRRKGRSVAEQSAANRAVCDEQTWRVVVEYEDNDRSASRHARKSRENWPLLLADLEAGRFDVLVLWEASRGDRQLEMWARMLSTCRRLGVLIHIVSDEYTYDVRRPRDWKTLAGAGVDSEYESEMTSVRIKRTAGSQAAKGAIHGKTLYGYRRIYDKESGDLLGQEIREDQAAVIREAARRVLAGETPYAVAQDFDRRGIPAPRGGRWDLTQIRRLCTRPAYVAKRIHHGKAVADAVWPPILDKDDFDTLGLKFSDSKRRTQRDSAVRHLLSGVAICGACGGRVRVQKNRGFLAYLCVDNFCVSRKEEWVDEFVCEVLLARMSRPDALDLLVEQRDEGKVKAAAAEVVRLRTELEALYAEREQGLSVAGLARLEAPLLAKIETAERRARPKPAPPILRQLAGPDAREQWVDMLLPARREVISLVMHVRILKARRGARSLDPDTIEITWKQL